MDFDAEALQAVHLPALAGIRSGPTPLWAATSADLHINLLSFPAHDGVGEHVNAELDVLLVGVTGEGVVEVDGVAHAFGPASAMLIPKGTRRTIRSGDAPLSYLSCHRRRAMLWPSDRRATGERKTAR